MKSFILLFIFLTGCVTTRPPDTILAEASPTLSQKLPGLKIALLFVPLSEQVAGSHHEGLLKVPQPWIFGLSADQKLLLRHNAQSMAYQSFIDELRRLGVEVSEKPEKNETVWTLQLNELRIDTFGDGWKGFGSAGNYWEARLGVSVRDKNSKSFEISSLAVSSPAPAKMDAMTFVNMFVYFAKPSLLNLPSASYALDLSQTNPVENAARLAARDFKMHLIKSFEQ